MSTWLLCVNFEISHKFRIWFPKALGPLKLEPLSISKKGLAFGSSISFWRRVRRRRQVGVTYELWSKILIPLSNPYNTALWNPLYNSFLLRSLHYSSYAGFAKMGAPRDPREMWVAFSRHVSFVCMRPPAEH